MCDAEACQRERRRKNAAKWRAHQREERSAERLRERLAVTPAPTAEEISANPLAGLSVSEARIAVGLEVQVLLWEFAKVLLLSGRIAVPLKTSGVPLQSPKVHPLGLRIGNAPARGPP